ncbi:hypothetical protein F383_24496 [Gossypium arboreum]|uniref:Uncharacterized protein n=1 Tax=Gossypium arboreum TaxID=29729 RepID=A0A0B0P1D5_GOSAR|nr:hypothetical protein F383_24496 [Gossypium arboreum]
MVSPFLYHFYSYYLIIKNGCTNRLSPRSR